MSNATSLGVLRSYADCPDTQKSISNGGDGKNLQSSQTAGFSSLPNVASGGGDCTCGLSILAVQDPPGPDGRPGAIVFASGLPLAVRREVAANLAWFDRSDARRARVGRLASSSRSDGFSRLGASRNQLERETKQ
jgi:hypothetical protein